MNLLEFLEGKKGENLATGALAYLLLQSADLRAVFFDLLSDASPQGPLGPSAQFGFYLEQALSNVDPLRTDPDGMSSERVARIDQGRIDLVIESDAAVIGLEAKFGAQFQQGQPKKYLEGVKRRAGALKQVRGREQVQEFLVVLAPESRKSEIERHIKEQGEQENCVFLGWGGVLEKFETYRKEKGLGIVDSFLLNQVSQYVRKYTGGSRELARLLPHIGRPFTSHGSPAQKELLELIWRQIPQDLTEEYTYGAGAKHVGWYMYPSTMNTSLAWVGFVESRAVRRVTAKEEAGVARSTLYFASKHQAFIDSIPEELKYEPLLSTWTGWYFWRIPFDDQKPEWKALGKWQEHIDKVAKALRPIIDANTEANSSAELCAPVSDN